MKRFFGLLATCIALTLVLGSAACKKDAEKAAEEAAANAEKAGEKAEEAAGEAKEAAGEAKEEAKEEVKEEAKEGGGAAASTGIEACDQLIELYSKCDKIPQASRDAFMQSADAWKQAMEAGGDAAKTQIESTCKQTLESSKESFKAMGC